MDKSFRRLFDHTSNWPQQTYLSPQLPPSWTEEQKEAHRIDHIKVHQKRIEDFFLVWFSDSIYTSAPLQLAMRDDRITIGNILSQWKAELKNRLAARVE
jgi:hypothetical protein